MDLLSEWFLRIWTAYSHGWGLVVCGAMYLWLSFCVMAIARKGHVTLWWSGWVPVVNLMVMCSTGKASYGCFWRLVVTLVALAVGIVLWIPLWIAVCIALWALVWADVWTRISHERGHSRALGLLAPLPVLNLVLFGMLAFGD